MILPMVTLGAAPAAYIAALLRSTLIEALGEDFIRTARAKGLRKRSVVQARVAKLIGAGAHGHGTINGGVANRFFCRRVRIRDPRYGEVFITAVTDRDYPLIMGVTLVYTALLVAANFLVDLFYAYVDPRIQVSLIMARSNLQTSGVCA